MENRLTNFVLLFHNIFSTKIKLKFFLLKARSCILNNPFINICMARSQQCSSSVHIHRNIHLGTVFPSHWCTASQNKCDHLLNYPFMWYFGILVPEVSLIVIVIITQEYFGLNQHSPAYMPVSPITNRITEIPQQSHICNNLF